MASTILVTERPAPPSGVMLNLTAAASREDAPQVSRRETCKGVRAGSVGWGRRWRARGGRGPGGVGGPGGRSWLEAEAAGDGGAAVLEVVEAGGDAGGVEGLVGVEGPVGVGEGEPVEVRAEQPVVDLAGPPGSRASWRGLSGATSVRTPSSSPGSQWAMPKPASRSMVRQVRPLRASDGPRPRDWPSSRRSTRAGSCSRHSKGRRRRASSAEGPMTPAQTCSTRGHRA
jgi:hypothetical protein